MSFSFILNLSKFYLSLKIQHNGYLHNEAPLNSSGHDYFFPSDPYSLADSSEAPI